ncbi:unnamed protein product [Prunus brigantina]
MGEGASWAGRERWDSEVDSHRRHQTVDAPFWEFPIYREVKVRGLHKVSMWDFVQVAVVMTRSAVGSFGSRELRQSRASVGVWYLGRVSSFGRGEGVSALVLVVLMLDMLG